MLQKIRLLAFLTLLSGSVVSQTPIKLTSPNGDIVFTFLLSNKVPGYSVAFKNTPVINYSALELQFLETGSFGKKVSVQKPVFKTVNEQYDLVVGKTKTVHDQYRQVTIPMQEMEGKHQRIDMEVRVFNDGLAFRYNFPVQNKRSSFTLLEENTCFALAGDPIAKVLTLPNYTTSHEGLYTTAPLSKITADTLIDMPALFQFTGNIFLGITEAALQDYAGMYLQKHKGVLISKLSPLPGQTGIKVKALLPHSTPWRVLLLSNRMGALIESNIITSLNAPCKIKDLSWLKPGTTTFPWWNGTIVPDSIKGGNNFETNKYYIDFCAANNITYHSVVEYGGHEWYSSNGHDYQPGSIVDVTKPVDGLDMQQVCDYAKQKKVGIRVWVHWKALYPKLDTAFALFQKWGISGMMVDFMDRDDQQMVNIQTEILQKAAAHHLHIQFHGAYKPTGLSRTYPNELTREGTLNYENDKGNNLVTPDADLDIPFTRMLAGSTDYHLGGFRAANVAQFKPQYLRPYVMGTRCHAIAMYVVLENYLGMVCDYPDAYKNQDGFEVLQHMPTIWDQTHVVEAIPGLYISIARRKGNNWYIGTINNNTARDITIKLDFLSKGNYNATIYADANDVAVDPNHLTKKDNTVDNNSSIKIHLAPGGGNCILIHPYKK